MSLRHARRIAGITLIAAAAFAAGAVAQGRFPNMDAAQAHLAAALIDLDRAPDRFAGHRVRAMHLIREAQGEINAGIAAFR